MYTRTTNTCQGILALRILAPRKLVLRKHTDIGTSTIKNIRTVTSAGGKRKRCPPHKIYRQESITKVDTRAFRKTAWMFMNNQSAAFGEKISFKLKRYVFSFPKTALNSGSVLLSAIGHNNYEDDILPFILLCLQFLPGEPKTYLAAGGSINYSTYIRALNPTHYKKSSTKKDVSGTYIYIIFRHVRILVTNIFT
jgi:hypothetical protein